MITRDRDAASTARSGFPKVKAEEEPEKKADYSVDSSEYPMYSPWSNII